MRRCSGFFVAVLALRTDSFRQIDEGMRVDVLSLVQNAVHGERHVVETVVHGIGVRVHGAILLGVQAFHAEAAAGVGQGARTFDGRIDALDGCERGREVAAFDPQVDGDGLAVEMGAGPPGEVEHG